MNKSHRILELLEHAIQQTYRRDNILITQDNPTERPSVHRIAHYLENIMIGGDFDHLNVDVDYNRNMGNSKFLESVNGNIIVDILVHIRNSNSENTLAVEVKMYDENNTQHQRKLEEIDRDKIKLSGLTNDNDRYKFPLGVLVRMNPDGARYTYFQHGYEFQSKEEIQ